MTQRRWKIVCGSCSSENVMRDAWAEWDEESQKWALGTVFDAGFCSECDSESNLKEISIN